MIIARQFRTETERFLEALGQEFPLFREFVAVEPLITESITFLREEFDRTRGKKLLERPAASEPSACPKSRLKGQLAELIVSVECRA
jgi:hypothetical protein